MGIRTWLSAAVPFILQSAILCAQTPPQSGYHLLQRIKLGGDGGWDYLTLDVSTRRLFIARSTHVMVVDADSGKVVGDISNTPGVHGVALAPELGRGFTSNGRDSSVTVFDLATFGTLARVAVGQNPDAILFDPTSNRVFAFNGRSRDATSIDARSLKVDATIPLDGRPEFAVADGRGRIYVNLEDRSQVAELNSRALTVEARWPLAPGEEPTGLALDREHQRLFIGCSNKLMVVMDAVNGRVVTTLPIGSGVDGTGFDPGENLAFSSNGDGTLTVIREETPTQYRVLDTVTTQRGARTMTVDPATHRVLLVSADFASTPAPTADRPHPRPTVVPGSFVLLIVGK